MAKNSFEEQLKQLEAAVEKLESGELTLEESLEVYELGMKRASACRIALKEAEQRVVQLQEDVDGNPVEKPFDQDGEG